MSNLCIIERLDLTFLKRLSNKTLPTLFYKDEYAPAFDANGVDAYLYRFANDVKNMCKDKMPTYTEADYLQLEYNDFLFNFIDNDANLILYNVLMDIIAAIKDGVPFESYMHAYNYISDVPKYVVDLYIALYSHTDINDMLAYLIQNVGCRNAASIIRDFNLEEATDLIDMSKIMYFESLDLSYNLNLVSLLLWQIYTGRELTVKDKVYNIAYHSGMLHS